MNQIRNSGVNLVYTSKGDFLVNKEYVFEIGGRGKDTRQIKDLVNATLTLDDIEVGYLYKIPLWLFGFMY
jgi:uncharacterized protein